MRTEQSVRALMSIHMGGSRQSNPRFLPHAQGQYLVQKAKYMTRSPPAKMALETQCALGNILRQFENVKEDR